MTITATDHIFISTASVFNAASGSALFAGITGEVVETTEKAVKVEAQTRNGKTVTAWFPRKALRVLRSANLHGSNTTHHTTEIARWFRPTGWTAKFMAICEDASVLAA